MGMIYETIDFSRFEDSPYNRDRSRSDDLMNSIQTYGFRDAGAIDCMHNHDNGKLRIRAGHHRLAVARELNIPIKYVISDDNMTIWELEKTSKAWTLLDYLNSFCNAGIEDYLTLRNYCNETGISITYAISLFTNPMRKGKHSPSSFKTGNFKIINHEHAEVVKDIINQLKIVISFSNHQLFVRAISCSCYVPEFDQMYFKKKIIKYYYLLEQRSNFEKYVENIAYMYNYRNQHQIKLKNLIDDLFTKK